VTQNDDDNDDRERVRSGIWRHAVRRAPVWKSKGRSARPAGALAANEKLTLLTLGTLAVTDGSIPPDYSPGYDSLARWTGQSPTTVTRHVRAADELGWLAVAWRKGRNGRNLYGVTLPASLSDDHAGEDSASLSDDHADESQRHTCGDPASQLSADSVTPRGSRIGNNAGKVTVSGGGGGGGSGETPRPNSNGSKAAEKLAHRAACDAWLAEAKRSNQVPDRCELIEATRDELWRLRAWLVDEDTRYRLARQLGEGGWSGVRNPTAVLVSRLAVADDRPSAVDLAIVAERAAAAAAFEPLDRAFELIGIDPSRLAAHADPFGELRRAAERIADRAIVDFDDAAAIILANADRVELVDQGDDQGDDGWVDQ
jgi:hypothetical protein